MHIRTVCLVAAAALLVLFVPPAAGAEPLDLKRYMPLSEIQPGMTGVGKTTLEGTTIVEFQVKVLAVLRNMGPKRDLIIVRCSGAGLEESGVIAGMSGSPVTIGGRLIGAVGYSFNWCKAPIAGVQPIEQMLRVTDEFRWSPGAADASAVALHADASVAVPASALARADVPLPGDRQCYDMRPILTPVMVSGASPRALERLREALEPFGMIAMHGGGAPDPKTAAQARLEPGAPLAVGILRGDIRVTTMGTITEIAGDRLYAFGHGMFGAGEANLPLMTGVAHVVIPSMLNSFRIGAPVAEVGRLVWDEETGVLGRLSKERAPAVPVTITIRGPEKTPERVFRCEMVHHRILSPQLAAVATVGGLTARTDLPRDNTLSYRIKVKPAGYPPLVRENLTVSPNSDAYLEGQVRSMVGLVVENPFKNLTVESVEVDVTVEATSRMAEIQEVRQLRNSARPGDTVPVEMKIRPWRSEPLWLTTNVQIPTDYPDGTCRITICGADEAIRQENREAPARARPDDIQSLLEFIRRDERRDQLFVRVEAPGEGLTIGRDEMPNLPLAMRTVLAGAARRQVTPLASAIVTRHPTKYVLVGSRTIEITVDRKAPP